MATVLGTVISVSAETDVKKNGGGTYRGWELIYKSDGGDVRTIAKPVQGLRFNAGLKAILGELQPGDEFTLEQEKNTQGFFDVKTIVKGWKVGAPSLPASAPPQKAGANTNTANSYQARDFETKEERVLKQRLIVRQSSLTTAISVLSVGAKTLNKDDVKALAEEFYDFVFAQKTGGAAIQEMEDDIPY